jgi:hypothetical protein
MPMKNPVHPGRIVRHDCLEPLGLSVTKGAEVLGVTRQARNNVVNGKSGISPEMASGSPKPSAARRRRGCACSLPTTSPRLSRTKVESKSAARGYRNGSRPRVISRERLLQRRFDL